MAAAKPVMGIPAAIAHQSLRVGTRRTRIAGSKNESTLPKSVGISLSVGERMFSFASMFSLSLPSSSVLLMRLTLSSVDPSLDDLVIAKFISHPKNSVPIVN